MRWCYYTGGWREVDVELYSYHIECSEKSNIVLCECCKRVYMALSGVVLNADKNDGVSYQLLK